MRADLDQLKSCYSDVLMKLQEKANIQDVCALVDLKVNRNDLNEAVNNLGMELRENYVKRELWDQWYH